MYMPRGDSLDRTFRVLQILGTSRNGYTIRELHERVGEFHEVDDRTVRRDIKLLINVGLGIQEVVTQTEDGRKVSRFKADAMVPISPSIQLDSRELLALLISRSMLKPLSNTLFYEDLKRFFGKIDALIHKSNLKYLEEIRESFHFEPGPQWALGVKGEVVDTVRNACEEGHELAFHYEGANGKPPRMRRVGPHFLYFSKGALYLVAEDLEEPEAMQPKTFSLARMTRLERLDAAYEGNRKSPEELFANSFGIYRSGPAEKIRVRFSPTLAPFIRERRWHASQEIISIPGGGIDLTLEAGITPDLIHWLMGHGAEAEVLEPQSVRNRISEELAAMVSLYPRQNDVRDRKRPRIARAPRSSRRPGKPRPEKRQSRS